MIYANLNLRAGPAGGASCPDAVAGDADYHSGNNGLRIKRFEVLSTNGASLPNITATGTSGAVYRSCPTIAQHPTSLTVCVGAAATLRVGIAALPLWDEAAYQWFKDGGLIVGQTNSTLTIPSAQPAQSGEYWVRVSNDCGIVESQRSRLTVQPPVTVVESPRDQSACLGGTVVFSVTVSSNTPVTYQWRRGTSLLPGQNNSTLTLTSVSTNDAGFYSVLISDGICQTFATQNAQLTILTPASIVNQPVSVGICGSGIFSFSVGATGSAPYFYQWRSNGVPILGAVGSQLAGFFSGGTAQSYDVVVGNACGSVTSAVAVVRNVEPITLFADEPTGEVVCEGKSFGFNLARFHFAVGSGATYQWRKDGTNIPNARGFLYIKHYASTNDAGIYDCVVSNACGAVISPSAILTVLPVAVSVMASTPTTTEGASIPGRFTVTRNRSECGDLKVFYSLSGTASNGLDFISLSGSVSIPAGSNSAAVSVMPVDDVWLEGGEMVVLTVLQNTNYSVGATGQTAAVTILDNDVLALVVSTNLVRVAEETSTDFTVQLNGPPSGGPGVRVNIARSSGDSDLHPIGSTQLRFRQSDWFRPQPFSIGADADADSANGTAILTLSPDSGLSNVTVTAVEFDRNAVPELITIAGLPNGLKEVQLLGYPGSNYVVEATSLLTQPSALISWARISTNTADADGLARFTIPDATVFPHRFFRARKP